MTLRLLIALSGSLMASGLAGCGDGGDTDTTGSTGSTGDTGAEGSTGEPVTEVAFDDFYAAAEVAFCEWQVACRQYGVTVRCETVNHMESRLSMQVLAGVGLADAVPIDYMKEAIEVGRIGFDEEKAASCLAFVQQRTCEISYLHTWTEEELAGQAACEGVFTGRMGRNGPCLSAAECAEASICGFDPSCVDACCVGACRVLAQPLAIGEACGGSTACAEDSFCGFDPNAGVSTVCTASPKVGQPCDGPCATGSFCDYSGGTPVCRVPKAEGANCNGVQECEHPAVCRYNDIDYTGKCFRPGTEGEPCDPGFYGPNCVRFDNVCHPIDLVCAPLPGKGEGCPDYVCQGDYFCSEDQGQRCVPVADAGEPCGYSSDNYDYVPCSGDNYCDFEFDSGVCKQPSGAAGCPVPADPGQG